MNLLERAEPTPELRVLDEQNEQNEQYDKNDRFLFNE